MKRIYSGFLMGFCLIAGCAATPPAVPNHVLKVDDAIWPVSWASFDQDKVISYGDYQYALYWDDDRVLALVRRNLKTDAFQQIRFENYILAEKHGNDERYSLDGHRNVVLGISPGDGRLHLSWDHHNNELHYTRSHKGFLTSPPRVISVADFEPEQPIADQEPASVTYPRFVNGHEGDLYFFCRDGISGDGDIVFYEYDAASGKWTRIADRLLSGEGFYAGWGEQGSTMRNAYLQELLFDKKGRLHLTWIWRERDTNPDESKRWGHTYASNHDLNYAYSDDHGRTWKNNAGVQIADTRLGEQISIDSEGIVVFEIPVFSWVINQCGMALDSKGNPHVAMLQMETVYQPENRLTMSDRMDESQQPRQNYFHYWRDDAGQWHRSKMLKKYKHHARPAIVVAPDDTVIIYFQTGGDGIRCHVARAQDHWTEWRTARLAGPDCTYEDASKPDRQRMDRDGVLSITVDPRAQQSGKGLAFLDVSVQRLVDSVFKSN